MSGIIQFFKDNKPYPRADESVLHYLVCTENRDFDSAIRCLRAAVRQWHEASRLAMGVSAGTFLVGLLSAASGVGAWVSLSLVGALFTGSQAWSSRNECQIREKELELLKSYPELLEVMHSCYSKGVPALKLVHSYNAIVGVFNTESGLCQGTMPVQAFADQMQNAITTSQEINKSLNQVDTASLPQSTLYPHLVDEKPALPLVQSGSPVPAEVIEPALLIQPTDLTTSSQALPEELTRSSSSVPDTAGLEILDALVSTRRSTLLIGDTGAGKSVAQAYILCKLFELQPKTEAFVLTQKLDSFCGLAELGRVLLFDPTDPELALKLIGDIWKIYDERRRLPESERPKLPPVRLILADWLSINQALDDLKNEEPVKSSKYLTKLADIIYNGRELNVCLIIDLQSYNLLALGLKADRNSRKNFNLIGLGNYSIDELGMVNESYGVLGNLINDRYIVASESERLALVSKFKELQPISKAIRRPIIFSGLSPAQLALLPDLRKYRSNSIKASLQVAATVIESPPEESAMTSTDSSTELKVSDSLGEPLKTIWLFTKERKDWVTVRDVQRKDFAILKGKGSEQIHQYLGLLADSGYGEIDEEGKAHSSVRFKAS